jgi:hypothetical protein
MPKHKTLMELTEEEIEKQKWSQKARAKPSTNGQAHTNEESSPRLSQADRLVLLAMEGVNLFHSPGGHDAAAYATFQVGNHRETWPISSKGFRNWLCRRYYQEYQKVPSGQAVRDALGVLAGKALHDGSEHEVAVRLAEQDGSIWLDLAGPTWRVVRITSAGWEVVDGAQCPIRFVRRRGMLALPEPVKGGRIEELRPLVNLPDDDSWILFVAFLLALLRPGLPFPILAVNGEQGSAKSTLCRMARNLIDPNLSPLRRPPRDERDLMIAACNSYVLAFDNLSGLKPDLSDALCSLATGGGLGTRELFSDDEEKLFAATRPIILNGIDDVASRPDLLDRSLCLTLPAIPQRSRRDEDGLWAEYERIRPRVLGALLDAVAAGLRNLPSVKLAALPRMADFARWVTACEPALGWQPGTFLATYSDNRSAGATATVENSILAGPLLALLEKCGTWEGTARELLDDLETHADEKTRKHRDWPTSPRRLSGDLRRLAPSLRAAGVETLFDKHTKKGNLVRLQKGSKTASPPSPRSPGPVLTAVSFAGGEGGERGERVLPSHTNSPTDPDSDGHSDAWEGP